MLGNTKLVLFASLLVSVGSWGSSFGSWHDVYHVSNVFVLFGIVGGVILAWMGTSPVKPKD